MQWYEICIIAAAALFVVGVAVFTFIRKKQGKGGCGCDCAHCSGCTACDRGDEKGKEQKK